MGPPGGGDSGHGGAGAGRAARHPGLEGGHQAGSGPWQMAGSGNHAVTWALWLRKIRMENIRALHKSADCILRVILGVWVLDHGVECVLYNFFFTVVKYSNVTFAVLTILKCCNSAVLSAFSLVQLSPRFFIPSRNSVPIKCKLWCGPR